MKKRKFDFEDAELTVFVGGNGEASIGMAKIDEDNDIIFKSKGFGAPKNIGRINAVQKDIYTEFKVVDDNRKLTGETMKLYWFDIKEQQMFNFNNNSPQQLLEKYNMTKARLQAVTNQFEDFIRYLEEDGIRSLSEKNFENKLKHYKKAVMGNSGFNPTMNQNQNKK